MSKTTLWTSLRLLGGAAILVVLVLQFGAAPFVNGLRRIDPTALLLAVVVTAITTWCCAVRWSLISDLLDVAVPVRSAFLACYRSQFLNATLPGGILGDVDRAVRHGRGSRAMSRGLMSVFWDRATGFAVQATLAVGAALWLAALVQALVGWLLLAVAGVLILVHGGLPDRFIRTLRVEIRHVPAAPGIWPRIAGLSTIAVGGHALVFVVAARTVGVTTPLGELVAIALVVLMASAIPLNLAGWGPREGVAAWIFAASGVGASVGLEVAVAYGVMALVATLPGALGLLGTRIPALGFRAPTRGMDGATHG
ncbi:MULTISPECIES: lysylphosphatidylglycerol synthase transmembrane domain-containing protein [unclassified Nocardioides]|uniref:lysylphosphatidylglycerol synthase transmembrane domain-containing protein n=1 Tax=unclassified Nocardioides TaxID=2615069 RepID=UPI0006F93AB3|nr:MULTISPECIES: lysylphosphatidylglycerol synthase transmembrane domain-containing protein [unclassified Nocardioides]KRA31035.1 hypothetical protein ASD81_16190 [Nocardioides sp. Root614]KRA87656.1 hypothetical protein ASD84_16465 [Nocardioides sp. Root682]